MWGITMALDYVVYKLDCCFLYIQLLGTEEIIERKRDAFNTEVVSLAREKYHEQYEEEVELNATFNTFVTNYKAAYEGRNVRRDQIIDSVGKKNRSSDLERKL
jgi:hypothetical protein